MPIKFYWGEDDFSMSQEIESLRQSVLDENWASFNFDKITGDQGDGVIQGLNQAMTPPFGAGSRFVWLVDTTICQHCNADLLAELERTLPLIPDHTILLLSTTNKPDGRLKSTKLLQRVAEVREFSPIPPWRTEELIQNVQQVAAKFNLKLTSNAVEELAESVGNNTRQLYMELEKLQLYAENTSRPIDANVITALVQSNTQNSLKLAAAIQTGDTHKALGLIADLISHNEPGLRIVATLIGQFRTWLWVKLMLESGERDERKIAEAAEIANYKRIYFIKKEVAPLRLTALKATLPLLLELETDLKRGANETAALQIKIIELCRLFA